MNVSFAKGRPVLLKDRMQTFVTLMNVEVIEGWQGLLLARGGVCRQFCMVGSTSFIVFLVFCP